MAYWDKLTSRGKIEDRRAMGPTAIGGGLGVAGIVIVLLFNLLGGKDIDMGSVLSELENSQVATQELDTSLFEGSDSYEVFASTVLGSNNDLWEKIFSQSNLTYEEPRLVLFRGSTNSGCGGANAAHGPHYCPLDQTIYLDETFFDELKKRFGGSTGDVAQAYVIAHEVGHHVQNLLGSLERQRTNEQSIQTELEADCFAGLWAYSIKQHGIFESEQEIKEALDAAAAVGDDNIQKTATGSTSPETWTHGSSAQRVAAFTKGYEAGSVQVCIQ